MCSPLLIANLLPHDNNVKAIDIISAVSDTESLRDVTGSSTDVDGVTDMGDDTTTDDVLNRTDIIGRNTALISILGDRVTVQDLVVVVCDRLQGEVEQCTQVPTFRSVVKPSSSCQLNFQNYFYLIFFYKRSLLSIILMTKPADFKKGVFYSLNNPVKSISGLALG